MQVNSAASTHIPCGRAALALVAGLFIITTASAQTSDFNVAWESKFNLPPQDSNGWSILEPSSDSRIAYVSNSGNDGTGECYSSNDSNIGADYQNPTGPINTFATPSAALSACGRNNYPDFILFNRGDSWNGSVRVLNGRSATERFVLSWYGNKSEPRPLFRTGNGGGVGLTSNSAIVGLHFYANERDPNNAQFLGFGSVSSPKGFDANNGDLQGVLLEDCWFDYYEENSIQGWGPTNYASDLILRRNIISNNYGTSSHSQGLFTADVEILLEGNIFYHNGWYCQGESGECGAAEATIFNHNIYFAHPRNTIIRKNVSISPSSIHFKFTSHTRDNSTPTNYITSWNVLIDNNLLIDGELGLSIGGNDKKPEDRNYRWRDYYVTNNVITQIGESRPTGRNIGWGIGADDWKSGSIQGNVLTSWGSSSVSSVYGINYGGGTGDVAIKDNILYNINGGSSGGNLLQLSSNITSVDQLAASARTNIIDTGDPEPISVVPTNLEIARNHFIQSNNNNASVGLISGSISSSYSSFNANTYYATSPSSSWFSAATSVFNWIDSQIEPNASTAIPDYVDPDRTVNSYMSSLGRTASITAYTEEVLRQSQTNWRSQFTAEAVNDYIRSGFCIEGEECGSLLPPAPSAPPGFTIRLNN